MSILSVNESADFNIHEAADGVDRPENLASHLKALETIGYIQSTKQFIGRKPNTQYAITEEGRKCFREHLDALEELIK